MVILTPELIEKAAKAQCTALGLNPDELFEKEGGGAPVPLWHFQVQSARAALQAVLPDVVESAAKVAEGHDPNALVYRWVLARDIRSLLNKEDK